MKLKAPYERVYKSKNEEFEEKIKKRNETEEWIFGNKFGKSGTNNFLNNSQRNNVFRTNVNIKNVSNQPLNNIIQNPYNFYQNKNNTLPNIIPYPYIITPINNIIHSQIPYLYINPIYYPMNNNSKAVNNNTYKMNSQNNVFLNKSQNNIENNKYNYNNSVNNGYSSLSFMDLDVNKRDILKKAENERYRNYLLNQIEENNQRKINKKKELEEENRLEEIRSKEYFEFKEKQEQEYEKIKKMNKNN